MLGEFGVGCIGFSPLAQGMLTDRYLDGVPADSRANTSQFLSPEQLTDSRLDRVRALNDIASSRGQTLAQLALAWTLRDDRVTSTLIGASSVRQLEDNVATVRNLALSESELAEIERYAVPPGNDIWSQG